MPNLVRGQGLALPLLPLKIPQEQSLKDSDSHSYQLTLAGDEYALVELKATQVRLRLSLFSEANELITAISDMDSPGLKRLHIVASRAMKYRINVMQESGRPTTTQYRLTLLEKRTATPDDRERFALHILSWEAVNLYRQQEKTALYQGAEKAREAATRWQSLGDQVWAGHMFVRAGLSLFLLSEHQTGREVFLKGIAEFQKAGDRQWEALTLGALGLLELADGDYRQSFSLAVRTLFIWQATKDVEGLRSARLLQAMHYRNIGEWPQAEALCRQLLPEADINRLDEWDRVYREDVLMVLGIALAGQGRVTEGVQVLEEALTLSRNTRNQLNVMQILEEIGTTYRLANQPIKAIEAFARCAMVSRQLGNRTYESQALSELGNLYLAAGRRAEAGVAFTRAIETGVSGGKNYLANALYGLAQWQHSEKQFAEALTSAEQAIKIIEGLRVQLPMQDVSRVTTALLERNAYTLRLDLLMHLHERERTAGHDARALQASEFAHARSLVQLLTEQHQEILSANDPALTTQLNELRQHIARLTNEQLRLRMKASTTPSLQTVQQDLATALAELDRVTLAIRDRNPQAAALTLPAPLTLHEMQEQILDRDTLLLEYALGEERSFLFVVSSESLGAFTLPSRSVIEPVARQLYETLSRSQQPITFKSVIEKQDWLQKNERLCADAVSQLSSMLLKPAAALLNRKRLLIVKDGALNYVPFAALSIASRSSAAVPKRAGNNEQPLIVDHELVTLPSASTLAVMRRNLAGREPAPKKLILFADPVFDRYDERVATAFQSQPAILTETDRLRSFGQINGEGNFSIPRLPASRTEAEAILSMLPSAEVKAVMGFDATYKTATQGGLAQYRYIHFSTHGLLDESHPELSGLLLSQLNREGKNENGYFTTLDAFQLKLNAEMVVLSGCKTALGKEIKGEGLIGLTRGFMYAGSRRVLASLWQVNDAGTAELMKQFYQGMFGNQNLTPAAALRAAQLEIRKIPRWHSPYYWAAFILQGEW